MPFSQSMPLHLYSPAEIQILSAASPREYQFGTPQFCQFDSLKTRSVFHRAEVIQLSSWMLLQCYIISHLLHSQERILSDHMVIHSGQSHCKHAYIHEDMDDCMDDHYNYNTRDAFPRNMHDDRKDIIIMPFNGMDQLNRNFCLYESQNVFSDLVCDNLVLPAPRL